MRKLLLRNILRKQYFRIFLSAGQSPCTINYLAYKEDKLSFETDKEFSGPYPRYKCHFHAKIYAHYCPIYECYFKQDVLKWQLTAQNTSKLNDATDTITQTDATTHTSNKGALLAHAAQAIVKPLPISADQNHSIANQLIRPLSDDGPNMPPHLTASTKFDWGETTYYRTNSTITMQNVVSSPKISPTTTSQENIVVSSSKISPTTTSQENMQVHHLIFPNHDSSLVVTVATRTHVPHFTSTIPFKKPLSKMSNNMTTPTTTFNSSNIVTAKIKSATNSSNNSYATQKALLVTLKTELPFSSSAVGFTSSNINVGNNNNSQMTEPHQNISDFLPSSSNPPATQHEQAYTANTTTENWSNLVVTRLDDMEDWQSLLNFPEANHNLSTKEIMKTQFEDFYLNDNDGEKDGRKAADNVRSAASSIHYHARSKRNGNSAEEKQWWWWPNSKGWLSAGSLLMLVAVIIWVSSSKL